MNRLIAIVAAAGCFAVVGLQFGPLSAGRAAQAADQVRPNIRIAVTDLRTGEPIRRNETLRAVTPFQVMVVTNGVDCAGQFVVTALGASGAPPSVLVQSVSFIIGSAVGVNTAVGGPLEAGTLPNGENDFKVSASCNGAGERQFGFAQFEFLVDAS